MASSRGRQRQTAPRWLTRLVRDALVPALGTAAFVNEVFFVAAPRGLIVWPALIMLGVPIGAAVERALQSTLAGPGEPPPDEAA